MRTANRLMIGAAAVLLSIVVIVAAGVALNALQSRQTPGIQAQPSAQAVNAASTERFRGLIEDLHGRGVGFSMEFAASLPTGERSRTFSSEPIRVGEDYFCFGEPWNNATRYHCTPFANIISVTFTE
jgi:hypothetical protein